MAAVVWLRQPRSNVNDSGLLRPSPIEWNTAIHLNLSDDRRPCQARKFGSICVVSRIIWSMVNAFRGYIGTGSLFARNTGH